MLRKHGLERATKTRQYDLLRPNVGQKEPPRLDSTICYGQELARNGLYDLLRPRIDQQEPARLGSALSYRQTWARKNQELARKSRQDSAIRFVTAKSLARKRHQDSAVERATETRQYDLLWPRVGQKKPPRFGSTICYVQELARKSHQDSAVRFVTAKSWPEKATKIRQYDLLRPNVCQKEPPRLGNTFITAKRGPGRTAKIRQYDL